MQFEGKEICVYFVSPVTCMLPMCIDNCLALFLHAAVKSSVGFKPIPRVVAVRVALLSLAEYVWLIWLSEVCARCAQLDLGPGIKRASPYRR